MIVGTEKLHKEAENALIRIQEFDVNSLPRTSDLGIRLNFEDVTSPAQNIIDLFKRLSVTALQDFPDQTLNIIRDQSNNIYNLFKQILEFNPEQQDPGTARTTLINQVSSIYQPTFQSLHPFISYSLHRAADFQRLDSEARSTIQSIEDKSQEISVKLAKYEEDAKAVLDEIRRVAAEEGVTKQAVYFNAEYEYHTSEAVKWQGYSFKVAIALGIFAVLSLFIHKIPVLKPDNTYDTVQLVVSKFLIFSVMAYLLFLSAKNFLSHKHNAIVNKHRQNALMTHSALVEASGDQGVRDAVLLQASSCIFSPQSTGYASGNEGELTNQKSMVEILSRPVVQAIKEASK